jgi:hypothetical protein
MRIDLEKLLTQLTGTEANERMAGIRLLQEDLSVEKPNLTPEIIQALDAIATDDDNLIVKVEAGRLLSNDEYLDLYERLGITIPAALSQAPVETLKPFSTSNNNPRLYKIGRIFLGLMIAVYVYLLIDDIRSEIDNYHSSLSYGFSPYIEYQHIVILFISLILLVFAFILVRKYPIIVGALLLGLGVVSIILWSIYPPLGTSSGGFEVIILCYPLGLSFMLFGFLFLRNGLIRDRNKKNEVLS